MTNVAIMANRLEGRLFSQDGLLHMVVGIDPECGSARISRRVNGEQQILFMPLSEAAQHISECTGTSLDDLGGKRAPNRLTEKDEGWYFTTREGLQGPFGSEDDADRELQAYVTRNQPPG